MPVATPTCAAIAASFCLGSAIHGPNQPVANGMACKPICEAADRGGLDRASSQTSWPKWGWEAANTADTSTETDRRPW